MKKGLIGLLAGFIVYGLSASMAQAMLFEGDFNATFPDGSAVTSMSGFFEAEFDESGLTGSGHEIFSDLQILTSLTLDPNPLGSTIFDTSNTAMDLGFRDGEFQWGRLGVLPIVSQIVFAQDDFLIFYFGGPLIAPVSSAPVYSVATEPLSVYADSYSGSLRVIESVPEPATLALFGIGLAGLGFARKKKKSA